MKNPRFANQEGGILLEQPDGVDLYVDGGALYESALNGDFGPIAEYVPPPPAPPQVPQQVTRAQGKVVLIQMGLWSQVVAYVEAIEDPLQWAIAEVAVYETLHWQRNSPFLNQAATALGITQAQMDELFIAASEVML